MHVLKTHFPIKVCKSMVERFHICPFHIQIFKILTIVCLYITKWLIWIYLVFEISLFTDYFHIIYTYYSAYYHDSMHDGIINDSYFVKL